MLILGRTEEAMTNKKSSKKAKLDPKSQAKVRDSCELSDDQLENVAGGATTPQTGDALKYSGPDPAPQMTYQKIEW
jgi:hypothetical protein